MKKIKYFITFTVFAFFVSSVFTGPVYAKDDTTAELKKQIEVLQKRVEELENERKPFKTAVEMRRTWSPLAEIARMQEEMNQMFQNSFRTRGTPDSGLFINQMSYDDNFKIKDDKNKYTVELDMKGLDPDKTSIDVNKNSITIKAERREEKENKTDGSFMSSKSFSSFMRTIPVPEDADTSKVKSEKDGDKLVITLPKKK